MAKTRFNLFVFSLILLIAVPVVSATRYVDYEFREGVISSAGSFTETSAPVTGVGAIGFVCADSNCNTVSDVLWSGAVINSGGSDAMQLTYPTTLQSNYGYAIYYYKDGYILWEQNPNWWGTDGSDPQGPYTKYLSKKENCHAPIDTFSVTNDARANIPLVINVSASLDATTYAAIHAAGVLGYVPPQILDQYSVDIRVTLTIYDENDNVVNQQVQDIEIPYSGSQRVEFSWTPTMEGDYTARVTTDVTDAKCSSSAVEESAKEFYVLPEEPRNICYTLLNNLATSDQFPSDGETISITATKISNYADDNYDLFAIPTGVVLNVIKQSTGQTVYQESNSLSSNANNEDPVGFDFDWAITTGTGWYNISINGVANSALCNGLSNYGETVSETIYVDVKPNEAPTISGIPDRDIDEDTQPTDNWIDLWGYASDPDDGDDELTFLITAESNDALIDCSIVADRYVDCDMPAVDQYGYSDVTVEVSDGQYTDRDTFRVTVNSVNDLPVVSNIPDVSFAVNSNDDSIDLDDYVTDAEDSDDEITWTYSGNTNIVVTIYSDHVVNFASSWEGVETITFTATDTEGGSASDSVIVTVGAAPPSANAPIADAGGPYSGYEDEDIQFDGSQSTDNGTIVSYEWDFGDGFTGIGMQPTHDYANEGKYNVTLTVTDDDGLTDTDRTTVTVNGKSEKKHLFSISTIAPVGVGKVYAGDEVEAYILLRNRGHLAEKDIQIKVIVPEFNIKKVVNNNLNLGPYDVQWEVVSFDVPYGTKPGEYVFKVIASDDDYETFGYGTFIVEEQPERYVLVG